MAAEVIPPQMSKVDGNGIVPDHVVTLAQDGTSPNMGWPNKELTTLSLLRPKIP